MKTELSNNLNFWRWILTVCIILFVIVTILSCIKFLDSDDENNTICWFALAALFPPTLISLIAFIQLKKLEKINSSDNLMRLDHLWHTYEIINARKIIDKIFQIGYRIKYKDKGYNYEDIKNKISEDIYELSKPDTIEKILDGKSKFIYILALIEFFDTLGFMYLKEDEDSSERGQIEELFKDAVIFYYDINWAYIKHITDKPGAKDRFKNFRAMYNYMKDKKTNDNSTI